MNVPIWVLILAVVLSLGVGAAVAGYVLFNKGKEQGKEQGIEQVEQKYIQLGKDATKIIEDAKSEGERRKKELISEGKAEVASLKEAHEKEVREKKADLRPSRKGQNAGFLARRLRRDPHPHP